MTMKTTRTDEWWERFTEPHGTDIDCIDESECGDRPYIFKCAGCGYVYTHQFAVELFFRGEDADVGEFLEVSSSGCRTIAGEGNPSSRRQGLRILLSCENCDAVTGVTFAQHKGNTLVNYEVVGKEIRRSLE